MLIGQSAPVAGNATTIAQTELAAPPLEIMLQAVVTLGDRTSEGHLIEAVTLPWLAFLKHIGRNPHSIHEIDWRKSEE